MKHPLSFSKLVMAAAMALPAMAFATITPEAPTLDNTDNCYMIGSAAELYGFAKKVNDGSGFNGCGKLTADIVVNENVLGTDNANVNASGAYTGDDSNFDKWAPINGFAGKFHGQGHTISGLYFNDPKKEKVGLFGSVGGVEIDGLGLVDSYFEGSSNVGGFVGYAGGTVYIRNSYNSSVVRGHSGGKDWWCGVGGFVGVAEVNKLEIENSYNLGFVTGGPAVGGLVGIIMVEENFSVSNSYNAGDVKGTAEDVGGLVGYLNSGDVGAGIVSSYNTGSVCGGEEGIGGLVGYLDDWSVIRIVNSYNTGTVDGDNAGGLKGGDGGVYAYVYNSYNAGLVNGGNGDALGLYDEVYNFYYLEGSSDGFYTSKSAAEFADGTVAKALHGYNENGVNGSVWGQGLGRDALPTLTGAIGPALTLHVYDGVVIDSVYTPGTELPAPTREGYEFLGWYAKSDFSGSAVTRIPSDATGALEYFAKWKAQGGSGCYEIASAEDLFSFAARVNGGEGEICGKLTADITVNENVLNADGTLNGSSFTPWTPMYVKSSVQVTLNGAGKTISGLYFSDENTDNVGLFGEVTGALSISDLGVKDSYFKGRNYVGGLVGYNGGESAKLTITNSYNAGSVSGNGDNVGGLVGYYNGGENAKLTIMNSYNAGAVSGSGNYVGGLVGYNSGTLTIENSYNAGAVSGNIYVGGLVGYSSATLTITNSFNAGTVSGSDSYVGGLVGENHGTLTIKNSYNAGTVSGNIYVGGLVGYSNATLTITNSFNAGTVSGSDSYVGGLVGRSDAELTITNSFFLATDKSGDALGGEVRILDEFHNGTVALLLHNWCEKDGDNCKEGGLKGSVWGQDFTKENSLPDLSGKFVGGTPHTLTLHTFTDDTRKLPTIYLEGLGLELPTDLTRKNYVFLGWSAKETAESFADIVTSIAQDATGAKEFYAQWMKVNEKGCYEIGTAFELYGFANVVNNATGGSKICGKLVDNIVVNTGVLDKNGALNGDCSRFTPWTPMNVKSSVQVAFDGNGKIISGLYFNDGNTDKVGLFGESKGTVSISDLGIEDSYFKGQNDVGGLVGLDANSLTLANCYNAGTVSGSDSYVGGLVGLSGYPLTITNSYNAGTVSGNNYVGGLVGNGSTASTITNSFFLGEGDNYGGTGKSAEEFANGTVATLLRNYVQTDCEENCIDGTIWGQDFTKENSLPDLSGEFVGRTLRTLTLHTFKDDTRKLPTIYLEGLGLELPTDLTRENHVFLGWSAKETAGSSADIVTSIAKNETGAKEFYAQWMKVNEKGCYEIASGIGLYTFAGYVNNATNGSQVCGTLADNIVVNTGVLDENGALNGDGNSFTPWNPMYVQSGVQVAFDGNGKTISGLYFNNENRDYVGLFGGVDGPVSVSNLGIRDSYFKGKNYVGGLVGDNSETLTIENSYNAGTVSGSVYYVGGLVGDNSETLTIENSYNAGTVSGRSDVGGLVGMNYESATLTITNSYNAGTVSGSVDHVGSFVGYNYKGIMTITNSFYLATGGKGDKLGGVVKTFDEFADGSVAKALHDWCEKETGSDKCKEGGLDGTVWGQDLSKENSRPEFIERLDYRLGSVTFFEKAGKIDSAYVDATSDLAVDFPNDVVVSGPIKFKRSFPTMGESKGYSTIVLPFTPNFESEKDFVSGVNFYAFNYYDFVNQTIHITEAYQGELVANAPYLVQAEGGATELVFKNGGTFYTAGGALSVNLGDKGAGWTIYGTYEYKKWEEGDEGLGKTYGFVGAGDNEAKEVGQFKKVGAGAYIYPMRAYLKYEGELPKGAPRIANNISGAIASLPETINVVIDVAGDASDDRTVIGTISTRTGEFKFATDRWFDLNGRYLGNKMPTQKGTYYNNGKKVIVK